MIPIDYKEKLLRMLPSDMELEVVGDIHRGHIIPHPEKGTIQ
jgi:hypothetical protein